MAMSLLYKRMQTRKLLTMTQRPSPKRNSASAGFARSLHEKPVLSNQTANPCIEETSLFFFRSCQWIKGTVRKLKEKREASMTVEASVVLPLFLFFFLNLCSAIEMIRLHGNLELALREAGSNLAIYGHVLTDGQKEEVLAGGNKEGADIWEKLAGAALSCGYIRGRMIDYVGTDYLNSAPITNGAAGLQFLESTILEQDYLEVIVTYGVSPWSSLVPFRSFRMANRYYGHIWNGYRLPGEDGLTETELETVYVTKYGTVYHEKRECTYINLSIQEVSMETAVILQNKWGKSYSLCGRCAGEAKGKTAFITESGDCYHYSRSCSGLKRIITSITRREAEEKGYRACGRCAAG